jgi:hypothetical protein
VLSFQEPSLALGRRRGNLAPSLKKQIGLGDDQIAMMDRGKAVAYPNAVLTNVESLFIGKGLTWGY